MLTSDLSTFMYTYICAPIDTHEHVYIYKNKRTKKEREGERKEGRNPTQPAKYVLVVREVILTVIVTKRSEKSHSFMVPASAMFCCEKGGDRCACGTSDSLLSTLTYLPQPVPREMLFCLLS